MTAATGNPVRPPVGTMLGSRRPAGTRYGERPVRPLTQAGHRGRCRWGWPGAAGTLPGALTGCARSTGGTQKSVLTGNVSLMYLISTDPAIQRMTKQEATFKERFPGIQLTVTPVKSAIQFATLLAAGTAPNVTWTGVEFWDVVGANPFVEVKSYMAKDRQFASKDWYPAAFEAFRWPDKIKALPYGVQAHTMAFSRRIFQREGLPLPKKDWTLPQWTDLARRFTQDLDRDGEIDQAGFGNFPWVHLATNLHGGGYWDKSFSRVTIDTPKSIAGLEWLSEIQAGNRSVAPTRQMLEGSNIARLFGEGKVAFFTLSRFNLPVVLGYPDLDWDIEVFPTGPKGHKGAFFYVEGYAMTADTRDRDAAWTLMTYLCGRESQEQFYVPEASAIPAIQAVAEGKEFATAVAPGKNHRAYIESLANAVIYTGHPSCMKVHREVTTPLWREVTDGKIPVREFTRQARPEDEPTAGRVQAVARGPPDGERTEMSTT